MIQPALGDLALKHVTDKGPGGHNYTTLYEQYFGPMRNNKIRLAELGFASGGSAWMWHDYFPNATFWFVDINPQHDKLPPRSTLSDRDQADPEGPTEAIVGGLFDIVIDDASHLSDKTVASFKVWWNALKPGGLYVVEDLCTSYWAFHGGDSDPTAESTSMHFLKGLADQVNRRFIVGAEYRNGFDVEWIHFYQNIAFIKRTERPTSSLTTGSAWSWPRIPPWEGGEYSG